MRSRSWEPSCEPDRSGGVACARRVFREIGIVHPTEAPIDVLAYVRGLIVRYASVDGAEARLIRVGQQGIATVRDAPEHGRLRFSVAHELGHFELHEGTSQFARCTDQDMQPSRSSRPAEIEANAFAAEFLMPEHLFAPRCDVARVDLLPVESLANEFQVSLTACAVRFVTCCPERCCVVVSKEGKVAWAWKTRDFGFRIDRGQALDPHSLAYDFFKKGAVGDRPETVDASAWIQDDRLPSDAVLVEHSRALRTHGTVLTMLWIKSDADF